jgi:hypothetical protein
VGVIMGHHDCPSSQLYPTPKTRVKFIDPDIQVYSSLSHGLCHVPTSGDWLYGTIETYRLVMSGGH